MNIKNTNIKGVYIVQSHKFSDNRGSFTRLFCIKELASLINESNIIQINLSDTKDKGTVRGMHFQYPPFAEMKLIRCLKGSVLDVVVDLRKDSDTFLSHIRVSLTEMDSKMIIIPEGCAHGFQTLEDNCQLLYLHTAKYSPEHEGGIRYDDPRININWPLKGTNISEKDKQYKLIEETFTGIEP